MKDKLVRDVMQIGVPACKTYSPLSDVARLLSEEGRDVLVVMGEDGVAGVISQSDLARAFMQDFEALTAQDIMTSELFGVPPDVSVETAVQVMLNKGVHQVLVMPSGGERAVPVGVFSKRHIVEMMAE
jgi:predicted transcriptional regulator